MSDFDAHQSELPPRRHEDVDVDDQHEQQRNQNAAKEIEIDHIVQGDYFLKQTLGHAFRTTGASHSGDGGVPPCATKTK